MANDNNNINELVADDDDPTAEFKIPVFDQSADSTAEAGLKTYDADDEAGENSSKGLSVSDLKSDLRSREKKIGQLQYDFERLHANCLGLEAEVNARQVQTALLNNELSSSRHAVVRKEKLLKKRDRKISSLKFEIRQRDDDYRQLMVRLDELQPSTTEISLDAGNELPVVELQKRLSRTEDYADSLRQRSQDLIESNLRAEREIENLSQQLDGSAQRNAQLLQDLTLSAASVDELRSTLSDIQNRHDEEIRLLRFELGSAEETVVETEDLNNQLASDLVDACGFKDELERMLGDVEDQSGRRIKELQKEVNKFRRATDGYEQKLATKTEAISILIAELAKKSEQIDSIDEIEDVIQDIEIRAPAERVARVLVGTVDDQLLRFPLFKDHLTIGRTNDNDIQLKAGYVSRRHAVIQTDGETTRIVDWGSKNGIHVNSKKVSEHKLEHGDAIMIGNARFRYEELKKRDS